MEEELVEKSHRLERLDEHLRQYDIKMSQVSGVSNQQVTISRTISLSHAG